MIRTCWTAYPSQRAPHIKHGRAHHALDIDIGGDKGEAQHVAAYYRSLGVPVAFNVRSEAWHMDILDEAKLKAAAKKVGVPRTIKYGSKGRDVIRLKRALYAQGIRNFSGRNSSNRFIPFFGKYTKAAVIRFQKRHGLRADGVVGPGTWRKLL